MQHALGAEQRSAAKFKRDDILSGFRREFPASARELTALLLAVLLCFLNILRTHDNRSLGLWFPRATAFLLFGEG